MSNINYSITADWIVGGNDDNDPSYVRLTEEQKMKIIKAVWEAVFSVEYHGEEANGSAMGDIVLKETVYDEEGKPKTVHTVYNPNENKARTV